MKESLDKNKLLSDALDLIEEYKLLFHADVFSMLGISKASYSNYGLYHEEKIKNALHDNKVKMKVGLRKKWYGSKSASQQIALYKLIADEDELRRLTNGNMNISGKLDLSPDVDLSKLTDDELDTLTEIMSRAKVDKSDN